MSAEERTGDILSTMPVWVQVAANLGVFAVAASVAAFGFIRKRAGGCAAPFAAHDDLVEVTDHLKAMLTVMAATCETQKAILGLLQSRDREELIEREVQRRIAGERATRPDRA